MRIRFFPLALVFLLMFSFTACAEETSSTEEELIELYEIEEGETADTLLSEVAAVTPPDPAGITLSERPSLEDLLALMPETLEVTCADGTAALVPVGWTCADYEQALSEYIFTPVWPEQITFAETAEIPVFTLTVAEEPVPIPDASVKLEYTRASYTGSELRPGVTVRYLGVTLRNGTDYTLSYSNNIEPGGSACAVITGKGGYTGTKRAYFTIVSTGSGSVYTGTIRESSGEPEGDDYSGTGISATAAPTASPAPTEAPAKTTLTLNNTPLGALVFDAEDTALPFTCTFEEGVLTVTPETEEGMEPHILLTAEQIRRLTALKCTEIRLVCGAAALSVPIEGLPETVLFLAETASGSAMDSFTGNTQTHTEAIEQQPDAWRLTLAAAKLPEQWQEYDIIGSPVTAGISAVAEIGGMQCEESELPEGARLIFDGWTEDSAALCTESEEVLTDEAGILPELPGVYAAVKDGSAAQNDQPE